MIACYFGGEHLHKIGREAAIMYGMLFILVQQFGLYTVSGLNSPNEFLFWSFVAQLIGGLGSGLNSVSSMAMVVSSSKASEKEQNIGLIEMATGIGFLIGPIWGSAMYQLGGYSAPFAFTSKLSSIRSLLNFVSFYSACVLGFISIRGLRLE